MFDRKVSLKEAAAVAHGEWHKGQAEGMVRGFDLGLYVGFALGVVAMYYLMRREAD